MEKMTLPNDINIVYVTATSFPGGITEAHKKLHELVPFSKNRRYFAVSRPEIKDIVYRAAAEELTKGEAEKLHCDRLVLEKGTYISLTISDYMKDLQSIDRAFKKLLSYPGLDPKGYCVEWYLDEKDVKCMIRLEE